LTAAGGGSETRTNPVARQPDAGRTKGAVDARNGVARLVVVIGGSAYFIAIGPLLR
jgi:hypothetical protein